MKGRDVLSICRLAAAGLTFAGLVACNGKTSEPTGRSDNVAAAAAPAPGRTGHAPNPSPQAPPSKAFAQYELLDTPKFYSTQQFTVFNPNGMPGTVDSIQYNYVYADDRFKAVHSYDTDVSLQIFKFGTPEQASAFLANAVAKSVPIAGAASITLPACSGQKRDNDDFVGPSKLVKKIAGPAGKELVVFEPGDFNMYDCRRSHNPEESVLWTDGAFYFAVNAMGMKPDDSPAGRAEEFALDYLAALSAKR